MKKILKWTSFIFVALIALGLFLESQKTPEQKAADAAARAEQEAAQFAQQQDQVREEMATLATVHVSNIAMAYRDNSVAADQQFKDKKFKVTGTVAEISTDFTGNPTLTLRGGVNQFLEPHAKFDAVASSQIAKIRRGQNVTLVCIGGGDIAKAPILRDCVIP